MDRRRPGSAHRRQFTVEVRRLGASAVVAPQGELDHHSAEKLGAALTECVAEGCARIVIDCSGLTFCDSMGLNVLLAARIEASQAGGEVQLAALPPMVARVFEITGAGAVFTVHDDLKTALASLPVD
ncbi:STAS domain-containing protein [Streptomyces sp. ACA25]|uniref:STAS domain-containing protein n=1 Tax=Streptomyces sp. ACA25 TaxID=3022596 RepID=UPI00230720CD|nr:STAS domain-containing protein [Streptomyces sp. ACA25]MDB1087191.1 STAS domain-containing protein [Streptomyces sp. ACA25]